MTTQQAIKSANELNEHFFLIARHQSKERATKLLNDGVMVDGKVRKEVLTSIEQGKIILEGRVLKIQFENLGGGVYRAFVEL
jgi:hypothetical protein